MPHVSRYGGFKPKIGEGCFVAENATLVGDVILKDGSSVWFGAVLRAEVAPIVVGPRSNIQDNCTLHTDLNYPITIGEGVSVGHNSVIHGASIGNNCLIGMSTTILNGARIGNDCMIGAGALVLQDSEISEGSLVLGFPAAVKRKLTGVEKDRIRTNSDHYSQFAKDYLKLTKTSKRRS